MANVPYTECQRCGRPMFGAGRTLSSGRKVCHKCHDELWHGNGPIDDGVARTWEMTKEIEKKRIECNARTRTRVRATHKISPMELERNEE